MKPFVLDSSMTTMAGVFYPTGHMFVMFPTREDAQQAAQALLDGGHPEDEVSLITPDPNITPTYGRELTIIQQLLGNLGRFGGSGTGGNIFSPGGVGH